MKFIRQIGRLAVVLPFATSVAWGNATPIHSCGYEITHPGIYYLATSLDCSGSPYRPAIKITNTHNVLLKLKGRTLRGKPNATYGGQGTGIQVYGSKRIQIDGPGKLAYFKFAIKVLSSQSINIDGDRLGLLSNEQGVFVSESKKIEVDDVLFKKNVLRDVYFSKVIESKVEDSYFYGGTTAGVLLSQTQNILVQRNRIGLSLPMKYGIALQDSQKTYIVKNSIGRATLAGINLAGNQTLSNLVKDVQFGIPVANACDLRAAFGAEAPQTVDSNPLTTCP